MFIKLWCDPDQFKKIRTLPSCFSVKTIQETTASGHTVKVHVLIGNEKLKRDIDTIFGG